MIGVNLAPSFAGVGTPSNQIELSTKKLLVYSAQAKRRRSTSAL